MVNSNYDKSFPVSWEELHRNSRALAWRLLEMNTFKGMSQSQEVVWCLLR